jgi:two-component system sensor histidine kinase PilS (NtrC family)
VGVSASAILDAVPTGVMAADGSGALRYANRAARRLLGLADAGGEGCDLVELLGGAPDLRRALVALSGNGESRHELRFADDAGDVRVVGLTVMRPPQSSYPELGAVVLFRDVAERREASFDGSQLDRWWALGRMVADMAHEVRNPLAALQFLTEALAAEMRDEPRAGDYVRRILKSVGRIDALVCSAIAFAEPAPPQPRRLSVVSLIERALAKVDGAPGLVQVSGEELASREIFADPDQVISSLAELIENSVEAAGSATRVALRLAGERERSGRRLVRIEVRDEGPGIARDMLSRVFDPFFTTRPNRTGMGLAFAQMLARQNGGRVLARSTPGVETVFSLVLPEGTA